MKGGFVSFNYKSFYIFVQGCEVNGWCCLWKNLQNVKQKREREREEFICSKMMLEFISTIKSFLIIIICISSYDVYQGNLEFRYKICHTIYIQKKRE